MKSPNNLLGRKISRFFSILAGKQGKRTAVGTVVAIAAEGAAIGIGIAALVSALPLTALFASAGLVVGGAGAAVNAAGTISQRKHLATITEKEEESLALQKENLALQRQNLAMQEKILAAEQQLLQDRKSYPQPAAGAPK